MGTASGLDRAARSEDGGTALTPLAAMLGSLLLSAPAAAGDAGERLAPGDVLEILPSGSQGVSYLATVQTTGTIVLPGRAEVNAAARTTAEIEADLARVLGRAGSAHPAVTVKVLEFRSRSVWVHGEVQRPGRKRWRSGLTLLEALLEAGGFTPRAAGEVVVERRLGTFPDGRSVRSVHLSPTGPTPEAIAALETVLDGDDVVTVQTTTSGSR